jgi:hypothetical protein
LLTINVVYDHTCCSDHADPFFIEKGCPAEREGDKTETSRDVVHIISTKEKLRTGIAWWPPFPLPSPSLHSQLIRAVPGFYLPPPLHPPPSKCI